MSNLIVGGTKGLGLELARDLAELDEEVIVIGRTDPGVDFAEFREFDLAEPELPRRVGEFVMSLPTIHTLIGFFQDGLITDLKDEKVDKMIDVGGRGLIFFVKKILEKQNGLDELITITSTSHFVPRQREPVYNFVKAGAGHYSNGQSLDERIDRTLVVAPSGMKTPFWEGTGKDTSHMLDEAWVAEQITKLRMDDYHYRFAKILGPSDDARVDIVETR